MTFFCAADYQYYLELMAEATRISGTEVWAYCLMPNHVHMVMVPAAGYGLRASLGEAHRRYTRHINFRAGWRGHLWQDRFHSFPMDEQYLLAAVKYVELNPVMAQLCRRPQEWRWSSANAHLAEFRGQYTYYLAPLGQFPSHPIFRQEIGKRG